MKQKINKSACMPFLKASFPDYNGKKFYVEYCNNVTFYDLNWSGGTKNDYVAIDINSLESKRYYEHAPWIEIAEGKNVPVKDGIVIAKHTYFCGHDMGVTFYVNPNDASEGFNG